MTISDTENKRLYRFRRVPIGGSWPLGNMSVMTYTHLYDESNGQASCIDAWRGKDTSILQAGAAAGRFSFATLKVGEKIAMPHSRPMPSIGRRCHELRVADEKVSSRIVYRIDEDAIVILEVFSKKTGKTPKSIIDICRTRLREYDHG